MNLTVIIGLDGMPYRLIKDLAENGTLPNMKTLIEEGVFRQMASSIPEISSVAWSSIITGKNPAEHGTFGFIDFAPNTYRLTFPNFASLKAAPFWESKEAGRSVILNVPSTYPAREFNGISISGFVALNLEKATYPPSLLPYLQEINYQVDVDYSRAGKSIDYFLRDLERTLESRIDLYRHLWKTEDWSTFMLVFTGCDRLAHYLWHAYEDSSHMYHAAFLEHLRGIDTVIGEIAHHLEDDDNLLLLSDHGFELLEQEVFVNHLLEQEGFLAFEPDSARKYKDIGEEARAFALDPGRIYIHYKDKYPRGCVQEEEGESLIRDIKSLLNELEIDGKKVIERVYRKEEIFDGPLYDQAPDLVPVASSGFNLRPTLNTGELWGKDQRTGKHTQHDAFLFVRAQDPDSVVPKEPSVLDIVPILENLQNSL